MLKSATLTAGIAWLSMDLERIFRLSRPLRNAPTWVRYPAATVVVLAFFVTRSVIDGALGGYPFLLFFPAIILVAALLDRGTGAYAALLSAGLSWYFFMPPVRAFIKSGWEGVIPLALYVVVALFLAISIEALRSTAERLVAARTELERADRLKRLLLVDVNHRVKNHLASVNALLRLSFRDIKDPTSRRAMEEASARINVLGRLYTRLNLGERTSSVCGREFVCSLCEDLRDGVLGGRPVVLKADADTLPLSAGQAAPLGLIINELVENALKYAFPENAGGEIRVKFSAVGDDLVLTVQDNGVGFDPNAVRRGVGTRLVQSLGQQLGGRVDYDCSQGTTVTLRFSPERIFSPTDPTGQP
jgi:two-component sensor histidine kinase